MTGVICSDWNFLPREQPCAARADQSHSHAEGSPDKLIARDRLPTARGNVRAGPALNHIAGDMQNINEIVEVDLYRFFHVLTFEHGLIEIQCDPATILVVDQPFLNRGKIDAARIPAAQI